MSEQECPLVPSRSRVIGERIDSPNVTSRGLYLPQKSAEDRRTSFVRVLAIGDPAADDPSVPPVGSVVVVPVYGGTEVDIGGRQYVILSASDIVAEVVDPDRAGLTRPQSDTYPQGRYNS